MPGLMAILFPLTVVTGLALAPNVPAGVLDPDCDAGKAAKSAAMKATVGVGGRCSPKEALTDTAKDAAGIEDKGPIEKRRKNQEEGVAKKAAKKAVDAVD